MPIDYLTDALRSTAKSFVAIPTPPRFAGRASELARIVEEARKKNTEVVPMDQWERLGIRAQFNAKRATQARAAKVNI